MSEEISPQCGLSGVTNDLMIWRSLWFSSGSVCLVWADRFDEADYIRDYEHRNGAGVKIPFYDVQQTHLQLKEELEFEVTEVLRSGTYILGEVLEALREILRTTGTSDAIGVGNGLDALFVLKALGVGEGDEVIYLLHLSPPG